MIIVHNLVYTCTYTSSIVPVFSHHWSFPYTYIYPTIFHIPPTHYFTPGNITLHSQYSTGALLGGWKSENASPPPMCTHRPAPTSTVAKFNQWHCVSCTSRIGSSFPILPVRLFHIGKASFHNC